jgi:hypothetical protein
MLLHTGDHIFHLVLGSIFLAFGLLSARESSNHSTKTSSDNRPLGVAPVPRN